MNSVEKKNSARPYAGASAARDSARRRFRRRDLPALLGIMILFMLVSLRWVGFPPIIRDTALRRLNRDRRYVTEIGAIRFRFPFGLYLDRLQLYRRGTMGPPLLEAERVTLTIQPAQWRHGRSGIRSIGIENGVIRRIPRPPDAPIHPIPWRLPDGEASRLEFRNIDLAGLKIAHATVECRVDGDRLWMDDGHAVLDPDEMAGVLQVRGHLNLPQRRYSGTVEGHFDPARLIPVADAWQINAHRLLNNIVLTDGSPEAHLNIGGVVGPPQHIFEGDITIHGTDFNYSDIPITALVGEGTYRYDNTQSQLEVRRVVALTKNGFVMGQAQCDFIEGNVRMDFSGTTPPITPADIVGLAIPELLREFQFAGRTQWNVQGAVNYRGDGTTDLQMNCQGEQVAFRNIGAGQIDLAARYHDDIFDIYKIQASILDGAINGGFSVETGTNHTAPTYRFELLMDRLDFRKLIAAAIPDSNPAFYEGLLSMNIRGTGNAAIDWVPTLQADGDMRIREGRLFRLPLFGGLSQILTRLIPGLDVVLLQTRANADFAIANNRLNVSKGRIQGEVFNVEGHGVYTFGEDLDFQVQLKLMRDHTLLGSAVRTLTFPLSKLFEFQLDGSLDKPRWYPVNFSADLLRRIRDLID